MQNVPQIVRERLRTVQSSARQSSVGHPEADILAAFGERTLPGRERDVVLDHLARCGDCREVVALSLPVEDSAQLVRRPAPGGWLTWPALRWGVVAAGIVAVAAVGVVQYKDHTRSATIASLQSAAVKMAENEAKQQPLVDVQAPTGAVPSDTENGKKLPTAAKSATDSLDKATESDQKNAGVRDAVPSRLSAAQPGNPGVGGPIARPLQRGKATFGPSNSNNAANQWQQSANTVQNQAVLAPPPTSYAKQRSVAADQAANGGAMNETVEVAGGAPGVDSQTVDTESAQTSGDRVRKAKLPVELKPENAPPSLQSGWNGGNFSHLVALPPAPAPASSPNWTITAAGRLQRSLDHGQTWQDVDVTADAQALANSSGSAIALEPSPATMKNSRKAAKQDAAFTFRAIAASGTEVWAGGSAGALYHSIDAGNHWSRIVPAAAGTSLTGDIVSVEFSDTAHGKISTSTSETWTTGDTGLTWQKQ